MIFTMKPPRKQSALVREIKELRLLNQVQKTLIDIQEKQVRELIKLMSIEYDKNKTFFAPSKN